ncbi:MAG: hypothetical protein U9R50_10795 [Campylobacterota bacterium]|nr:hypothetical protein [Campylobacterota bacterium]
MKYLVSLALILAVFSGCNSESSSDTEGDAVKNVPQPNVKNADLQPPKPPSL